MHVTRALIATASGMLLVLGHSGLLHADDPYTDRTHDAHPTEQTTQETDPWVRDDDPMTAEERAADDPLTDEEFVTEDEEFAQEDDPFLEDDEFAADPVVAEVSQERLETLAQIHVEMQDATTELADTMAGVDSATDAQELQSRMIEKQIEVIELHGWTRDEYNEIVDAVNADPELRAQFIDLVAQESEAVAGLDDFEDDEFDDEFDEPPVR